MLGSRNMTWTKAVTVDSALGDEVDTKAPTAEQQTTEEKMLVPHNLRTKSTRNARGADRMRGATAKAEVHRSRSQVHMIPRSSPSVDSKSDTRR
jgi:hypothetical protein|eukprot:COSAG01_NODE_798_length_13503_cov_8.878395_11_plen_94_part_00